MKRAAAQHIFAGHAVESAKKSGPGLDAVNIKPKSGPKPNRKGVRPSE